MLFTRIPVRNRRTVPGVLAVVVLESCTLTTTGGYVVSEGSNPAFEGVHATAAEVLTPTLASNNCMIKQGRQIRIYTLQGRLVEVLSEKESEEMNHEFLVANYCA